MVAGADERLTEGPCAWESIGGSGAAGGANGAIGAAVDIAGGRSGSSSDGITGFASTKRKECLECGVYSYKNPTIHELLLRSLQGGVKLPCECVLRVSKGEMRLLFAMLAGHVHLLRAIIVRPLNECFLFH